MKNIRLATLAKIIIPLFLVCAAVVLISFVFYQSAISQENDFLNTTIESFGVVLSPHITSRLDAVQSRSAMLYTVLTCVIGVFVVIALLALFLITYKLAPIQNVVTVATKLAHENMDDSDLGIPDDELGDLTRELAYLIKVNHDNMSVLEDALEKANAASKAKGDFLSNMSHEIRTPINAIIGMTNIAKTAQSVERKDYALEKIGDASNHLLGIINDILDMSKIEADKLELYLEAFVFEEALKKAVNIINFRAVEKKQKLSVYIDDMIPRRIISDDQRLAQIITNLLSNAVKFTAEHGTIDVYTKLLNETDGFCEIQFDVVDNGVGISEEQQIRLFHPFEQAESSTTRKYGGTGLGLTIAKRIIELMGGDISVKSQLGEGSTFTFTIKAEKPSDDNKAAFQPKDNLEIENIRILIVDDDVDVLEYFVDIATRFNIACDVVGSGQEAIERLESGNKYDMCFVDWKMPSMDGIELSRYIKEIDSDRSVLIMISSVEWEELAEEANEAGIDKFLPKPIFPSTFIECVNHYLGIDLLREEESEKAEMVDSFKGYRVLLAEDVEINREIVMALLEPTQLEIDCAENGAEAVRMFSEAPDRYNIVFMDLQMPEMDGLDATRAIRALGYEHAKTIPIIAMTANVFKEDVDNCIAAGMDDHIGKPVDFEVVMSILRQYLYRQQPTMHQF
ncbi:MAG: response regulator [Oscillospiraceae bacterium]|nr:response regulator [Oscillospiraceae bacterium]